MKVLVIGMNGIGLMPTSPRKARKLLGSGKAEVVQRYPFTIRLNYKTGSAVQDIRLGIDTGESHIGAAVTAGNKVLVKAEIGLRTSMEKRILMETRREYRRGRRYRKTRYRHPKFRFKRKRVYVAEPQGKKKKHWQTVQNRMLCSRPEGWLPPSIQSKVDHHINWINKFLTALPRSTVLNIEVARFDIQRMKNPDIHSELYQQGRMYEYENVKAYVLAKFGYTCPVCGHRFDKEHKPKLHHVTFRSRGATDNPDEYAPVCERCHTAENHQSGAVLDKLKRECRRKEYREPTFMNILRRRLWKAFPEAAFTYGNITNADRKVLGLPKTHADDAVAIALCRSGYDGVADLDRVLYIRQIRSKKRSLHEANPRKGRKAPNRTAKRNRKNTPHMNGYRIYDKVRIVVSGEEGYISGFTGTSSYVVDFEGNYLTPAGKTYKHFSLSKLELLESRTNNYISCVK